jgi:microcystin degradation protein MlrC
MMSKTFRIAVGGIHTECSTYSPVLMHAQDFRVLRGADLARAEYFAFLPQPDVTVLPLLHARAVPGGPVARATYDAFKAEFLDRLRQSLPLDGVYLAMHGAMKVEGMFDAEGDWIAAVRAVVGPDLPIAVSYDLHGNLSQRIIDQIDIFAAYRTAPHIDVPETMTAAWRMLLRCLRQALRPAVCWAPIPLLLPGERSSTEDEPAKSLYAALPAHDSRPGIWRADLMIGYVWADEPRATAAAVVTGTDPDQCRAVAAEIARDVWQARDAFRFGPVTGPLDQMLDIAEACSSRPVILADSGDNPTGGGVGDRADVLAALLARGYQGAILAGITDRRAVEACFAAGPGAKLRLRIGADLDPAGISVEIEAEVIRLEGSDQPHSSEAANRQAVIRTAEPGAELTVVLAAKRRPYHNLADFTTLGLDPLNARMLVVKSGYLSPELAPVANPNLMALTDGVVNQDIAHLANRHRPAGTAPFDPPTDYNPRPRPSARAGQIQH